MEKAYDRAEIKMLPDSEVEIIVGAPAETLEKYKKEALAHLTLHASIPGFRKGHAPEKMILEKVGEMGILEEAAELFIKDIYSAILIEKKLDTIGEPHIAVTKLAPGNPIEFKIIVALLPSFELPDYKKLAKEMMAKDEPIIVSEKDVENVVEEIRRIRAVKKEGEEKAGLPELTDEFVKTVGPFENVVDFTTKVKENLEKEKTFRAKEKRRLEIIGKIIEKTEIPLPRVLIEGELERMLAQLGDDVKRMGGTVASYLAETKKTESDLRREWENDAKTRVKFELILQKIGDVEKIKADEGEVAKEVKHIIEHYTGAVPERVRAYVEHQMRNEEVFKLLESQK